MGVVERVLPVPPQMTAEGLRVLAGVTYFGSNAKARRELGYDPRPLADGLRTTLEHEMRELGIEPARPSRDTNRGTYGRETTHRTEIGPDRIARDAPPTGAEVRQSRQNPRCFRAASSSLHTASSRYASCQTIQPRPIVSDPVR